jgi:putative membrane protein
MTSAKAKWIIYLSIAMYIAGLIGLNLEVSKEFFRFLTPFHLLSSTAILIYFEPRKSRPFWFFLLVSYFTGFFIEVAGVNTGAIFGEYAYGKTLGMKIWETPLLIGVNWFILSFTTAKSLSLWSNRFPVLNNTWFFVFKGAVIMTLLDFFAEPPAIVHDMWSWTSDLPPLQNYVAWFVVSAFLMVIFKKLQLKEFNPLAFPILILQFVFFIIQYLLL